MSHLTRLYVGPELDFDVQLVLRAADVPPARMSDKGFGPRLGWNLWLISSPPPADVDDPVFEGETLVHVRGDIQHA